MNESAPIRDEVIAAIREALRIVPPEKVKDPSNIYGFAYTDKIPEFEKADKMYDAWKASIEKDLDWGGTSQSSIEFRFNDQTIFWDAGFNADRYYLDELANDWLVNDEDLAREQGFTELADSIQRKIDEISVRVDELFAQEAKETELNAAETNRVTIGGTVNKDYFYIPAFYYKHAGEGGIDWSWYSLRFNNEPPPYSLTTYASKVSAGASLKDVIIRDLASDFQYPKDQTFVVDEIKPYDTAKNKKGETLTRVLVVIGLDYKIDTTQIHPLGMNLAWHEEGEDSYNKIKDYFNSLSPELYRTQDYIHIPMDGSQPADPNAGRKDEYHFADGSTSHGRSPIRF